MSGIELLAESISEELRRRLPERRKTQRENLALLVATMLDVRTANLMELAAALPRAAERIDMRYQWVARVLANPHIDCDAVMAPFAQEVLARAAAQVETVAAAKIEIILDQSKLSERHQVLMLALRFSECAMPLAWRVEQTVGPIGLAQQLALLDLLAAWLPVAGADGVVLADRFYGTPGLISACAARGWNYRLRLKSNLRVFVSDQTASVRLGDLAQQRPYLTDVKLTAVQRVRTNIGVIHDPGHEEPRGQQRKRCARDRHHVCQAGLPDHARLTEALRHRAQVLRFQVARFRPQRYSDPLPRPPRQARPGHGVGPLLRRLDRAVGPSQPLLARRDQTSTQTAQEGRMQLHLLLHLWSAAYCKPPSGRAAASNALGRIVGLRTYPGRNFVRQFPYLVYDEETGSGNSEAACSG